MAEDWCEHEGKQFLVVIDYYSRFPEIAYMSSTTSNAAINKLKDHNSPPISSASLAGSMTSSIPLLALIIQQIVTLSKYGHDALDICHP